MAPTEAEAVALKHVVSLTLGRVEHIVEGVVGQQDLLVFDPDSASGGQVEEEGVEAGIDGNGIGALGECCGDFECAGNLGGFGRRVGWR